MSRKGAKSRTGVPGDRSTRTKARTHVGRGREPNAELEKKLAEALEQQAATSEVLQVIASSPGELEPVFQAMLANAVRICEAKFGSLYLYDGDRFRVGELHNAPPAFAEFRRREPVFYPPPGTALAQIIATKRTAHTRDIMLEEGYVARNPIIVATVELAGFRTALAVPMLKDDKLIGCINIYRQEVRPFADKQIELVTNFAAQAVIAIENARLLNELRQRTDDLSEALEQKTATSEVLSVISSSPGELKPVFETMLENATRICQAKFGNLFLREGDGYRAVAVHGEPNYVDYWRREPFISVRDDPSIPLARLTRSKDVVHIPDLRAEQSYIEGNDRIVALVSSAGARTFVVVPMLKEKEMVGAIAMYRQEVRPFSDRQIELIKNFANQAVIAIENTRLLNELRESLQQQTATSEVLSVISSSPGELQQVFETILENAVRICGAKFGNLWLREGDSFRIGATHGAPAEYQDYLHREPVVHPDPPSALGQIVTTKQVIHLADIKAMPTYDNKMRIATIELAGGGPLSGSRC